MSFALLIVLTATLITLGLGGSFFLNYNKFAKRVAKKLSNEEAIQIAQANNNLLTSKYLAAHSSLTKSEAELKVRQLLHEGVLRYHLNNSFKMVYKLEPAANSKVLTKGESQISSDGDIIALAVKSKGKLSAAALCMKSGLPIEEAEKRLKFLQEKGVFEILVNENGTIQYQLNDLTLLEEE